MDVNKDDIDAGVDGQVIDVPVVMWRQVPIIQTMQKIVQVPQVQVLEKTVEFPQLQCIY